MIKQGMAAAYDSGLLLSYLAIGSLALTAACLFNGKNSPQSDPNAMRVPTGG